MPSILAAMRIVFFGATELGHRCCQALVEAGEEVVGIVSMPREFPISYAERPVRNVTYQSFDDIAERAGVPLLDVTSLKDESVQEAIAGWRPDFGLAIGWFYLFPRELRDRFPRGVAGIHASLLPRYRGGAPLVWAIINGEKRTGATLFYLDEGVDTGDVIAQAEVEIGPDDTIREVYERAADASVELVREFVPLIRQGSAPREQQDHSQATTFPQRSPDDGEIDWSKSAREIRDFIRAQTRPYPGAFTYIDGRKVMIWDGEVVEEPT